MLMRLCMTMGDRTVLRIIIACSVVFGAILGAAVVLLLGCPR